MSPEAAHMMMRLSLVHLFTADKSFEVDKLSPITVSRFLTKKLHQVTFYKILG